MRILHLANVDWVRSSGINSSVPGLAAAQANHNDTQVALLVVQAKPNIPSNTPFKVLEWNAYRALSALPSAFSQPDIIVFHGVYFQAYANIARDAKKQRIPYIITPRGSLTTHAQSLKRWKKIPANHTFLRSFFHYAAACHFLTAGEAEESPMWRGRSSFVIGNGVNIPPANAPRATPGGSENLRLVFVGRIDTHTKGLDILINAIHMIRHELRHNSVTLDIFGENPGDDSHKLSIDIKEQGIGDIVQIHPRVSPHERDTILESSDVFMLPSRSEGHPVAVLEAMAAGLPCIVSPASRVGEEIEGASAGWMTDGSAASLAEAIRNAINQRLDLQSYGDRAYRLVSEKYSWSRIAESTLSHYQEIIDRSSK